MPDRKSDKEPVRLFNAIVGVILAIIAFVTAVIHFIDLWQGNLKRNTLVVLGVAVLFLWLYLLYSYRKKIEKPERPLADRIQPAYKPWVRQTILAGMIVMPLVLVAEHQRRNHPLDAPQHGIEKGVLNHPDFIHKTQGF